jgi:hypothetical protein
MFMFRAPSPCRRFTDRPVSFRLDLEFTEDRKQRENNRPGNDGVTRTRIQVSVSLRKQRDRRLNDLADRARHVLASLKSYLMASEEEDQDDDGAINRAKRILTPWLGRK